MQGAPFSIDPVGIVSALREEQTNTPDYLPFKVIARENEKGIWRLEVTGIGRTVKLDESYEGCKVGWSQPIKGAAQILSVIPEDGIIHVHHGSSSPPPADGVIYLYPPSYLDPLLQYWSDPFRHSATARWVKSYNHEIEAPHSSVHSAINIFRHRRTNYISRDIKKLLSLTLSPGARRGKKAFLPLLPTW